MPIVYNELRSLARSRLSRERGGQTLQATALVHEAYMRLVDSPNDTNWDSSGHFFAAAAEAMRRILIDNARHKASLKKGGHLNRVDLDVGYVDGPDEDLKLLSLDAALERLKAKDERKAKLIELRYFGGLKMAEAAQVLKISLATAERDWAFAKAWLFREMGKDDES